MRALGLFPILIVLVGAMKFPGSQFLEKLFFTQVNAPTKAEIARVLAVLKANSVRALAWDMDLTAVQKHSMGRLERSELDDFLNQTTPGFITLVPELHREGFGLAIATHSDEAEYNGGTVNQETHIVGEELARALVNKHFSKEVADSFYIVAYNPSARGDEGKAKDNLVKRYHMRLISAHFGVKPSEIMFFEDTPSIVLDTRKTCSVHAVQVNPRKGFQAKDILDYKFT